MAMRRSPARVRAGASVREHASGEDEPFLVVGAELGQRRQLVVLEHAAGQVQLRLNVGLAAVRADVARVTLRAEEQADGLSEDRLAGPGLARDRVQPRGEGQLGLVDQHEVLDAQTPEHAAGDGKRRSRSTPSSNRAPGCP
jgi:hypothetical protein